MSLDARSVPPVNRPALDSEALPQASMTSPPLARPPRTKRRARADRGLPPDTELTKLAAAYLDRLVFIQSSPHGFRHFQRVLDIPADKLPKDFREEICRIEQFNLLNGDEQILGFSPSWQEGRVELVLHPTLQSYDERIDFLNELLHKSGINWEKATVRDYSGGPTFVSCRITRDGIKALEGANPLRAAHPLEFSGIEELRGQPTLPAPMPPSASTRSTIKVGMFDAGIDASLPLLAGHVEEDVALSIDTEPTASGIAHGTAVAGALLYGPLNSYSHTDQLPTPPISVVSIRALPTSDPNDVDLYESIDVIEDAVPKRKDIKVFAVNFGPRGPILDDILSRFTYVLDSLAVSQKVTFVVASGNDGDASDPDLRRIQVPSDVAHGLGVAAYTVIDGHMQRAFYSCVGPGREAAKNKPDVSGFGGCTKNPIHLVSTTRGHRVLAYGTSFAGPEVARLVAQAAERFERGTALLARGLVIHTALHPDGEPDGYLGHGCVSPTIDDLLSCPEGAVTILFQGAISPKDNVKLPVCLPADLQGRKCRLTWTVAALTPVDSSHPGDYTCGCIEDTFYPHARIYDFSKRIDGKRKQKTVRLDDKEQVTALLKDGWKQADFPTTDSGNEYRTEEQLRADCKWEPIVRRRISKMSSSLHDPFIVLHAISRNRPVEQFDYCAIVTIEIPGYDGDLYTNIRQQYSALTPIRVRSEAEIRVSI